ncbi:MAG TPA: hypothetical protein VHF26_05400, partial [Trebonia sp.]|nr:hypothetical protein [Trebonia sp.]
MAARERVVRSIHDLAGRLEQRAALVRTAGIRNAIRTTPRDDAPAARADGVQVGIEMFTVFRGVLHVAGWAYDPQGPVRAVGVATGGNRPRVVAVPGLPSPDLIGRFGPAAAAVRFAGSLPCRDPAAALSGVVCFLTEQGWARRPDAPQHALAADAY